MKKVLPALVITAWLMQVVTINVLAAPFHLSIQNTQDLQTSPPVVDLNDTPNVFIANVDVPTQDGTKNYTVTGDGTEQVIVEGTAVSHCRNWAGTWFCTYSGMDVTVKNNNGAHLVLNACAKITIEDAPGIGSFFGRSSSDVPYSDCAQYDMPIDYVQGIGLRAGANATSDTLFTYHYILILSYEPISTCTVEPVVLTTDTYTIDPLIETPLGPAGTPPDDQIYTTVTGEKYKVSTEGTWNDGSGARADAVISWDGETWLPLMNMPICVSTDGTKTDYYIVAESETFYIRANDTAGNFDNNVENDPPFIYTISLVYMGASCESQYTYDSFTDLVGFVGVPSADDVGVLANNADIPLIVGDWYVVRWNYDTWTEAGLDRKDLQYKMALNWAPLSAGNGSVWCVSTSGLEVLVQASAENLYLRVNDQDTNFANNTGTPYYDLYHVTFTRAPEACELSIVLGDLIEHKTVNGNQSGGLPFAQMVGGTIASIGLDPGGIYVVDTVEGPWWQAASNPFNRYDMAVTEDASTWTPLADWTRPSCNVPTDTLGHRRVVFTMPTSGEITYSMRVNATGMFFINQGAMSWDLYGARSASEPVNTCFDGLSLQVLNEFEWLDVRAEGGEILTPDSARYQEYNGNIINGAGESVYIDGGLVEGRTYSIETPAGQGPWYPNSNGTKHWDIELSDDNGETWFAYDAPNVPIDCYSYNEVGHTIKVKFIMQPGQLWKIRVNDTNGDFGDNTGNMAYKFYALCEGMACTASIPNDSTTGDGTYSGVNAGGNVCSTSIVRPAPFTFSAIADLGNYFGSWFQYVSLGIFRYMAWCPVHTNLLMAFLDKFKTVEPLATVYEWIENFKRIRTQIQSYNWGDRGGQDFSLFNVRSSSQLNTLINNNVFPSGKNSVWDRGKLISFGQGTSLPDTYYSCSSALTERIPATLKMGVCFVSSYFVETSASFWVQIALDIGAFFMMVGFLKSSIQEIIYMLTGVKPWTKSGANASIDKLTDYLERENRNAEIERASRINSLTNKYWDYRKR